MISTQTGDLFNECSTDGAYLEKCFGHMADCGFEAIDYNMDHFLPGNLIVNGQLYKCIDLLGDRLTCLHIHDNDGANDSHMIPFTQTRGWRINCTDCKGMTDALRDIGYKGNLSFEPFRGVMAFPKEVESEALRLISAIGRYFRSQITGE